MFAFLFKLILAGILIFIGKYLMGTADQTKRRNSEVWTPFVYNMTRLLTRGVAIFLVLWAFIGTSMVWVPSGKIMTLKRVYFGKSLLPGQIVAIDGELGPQARILTAGFHIEPLITLMYEVETTDIFTVPNGQCAIMSAKDGIPIPGGSAFAEPWPENHKHKLANDASFFLTEGKGQRGPQTTVLMPGSYTINPFLWEKPQLISATRVEQGTVGVVKSSLRAEVDFGSFKRPMPTNNTLRVLSPEKMPHDSALALIVPVGAIGVWEEPLPNGLYYINTQAYKVTMVPTVAQVYEYKGGYKKRTVDISVNEKGQIVERVSEEEVQSSESYADKAIFTQPEGWNVAQEMRAIVQVSPEMAPFVVASLGLTEANASKIIEDRVITPILRSITRDVEGGAQILIKQMKAVQDNGKLVLNTNGEPKTEMSQEFRTVKVLDLLENRASIEEAIESRSKPEAMKEGVTINEVRLSESAIPAELLIARKREQLAEQLTKAWAKEEIAQKQRQTTENAKAQAEQQADLVKAEISAKAALQMAEARTTEGKGEKAYLMAIAEGQSAQSQVLGKDTTARLQMFQQALKALENLIAKNPEVLTKGLENAHKFVPTVLVSGNGGNSLEGAAAIFGQLMTDKESVPATSRPTNQK